MDKENMKGRFWVFWMSTPGITKAENRACQCPDQDNGHGEREGYRSAGRACGPVCKMSEPGCRFGMLHNFLPFVLGCNQLINPNFVGTYGFISADS
jgi:hypothetical protein